MDSSQQQADSSRLRQWGAWGILAGTLLAAAIAVSPNGADPDLWGHVQYGRDALRDGLARTTTYSYTAEGYRWINHENLSELALAIGVDTIGPTGLLLLKAMLGLFICAIPFWKAKDFSRNPLPVVIVSLLVAVNLTNHWNVRPQLFSFSFFALLLLLLEFSFTGWQGHWNLPWLTSLRRGETAEAFSWSHRWMRLMWLCVPLFFLWTNSHGGFMAGLGVLAVYLVCRMIEAATMRGWASAGMLRRLTLMLVGAVLATLVNPYSWELHQWMLAALRVPRPEITEWHPLYSFDMFSIAFLTMLSVGTLSLIYSTKPLDFTQLVVLALVAGQATMHQRHAPFLAMLFAFWCTPHVVSTWERVTRRSKAEEKNPHPALVWGLVGFAALLFAAPLWQRLSVMRVDRDTYPVSAIEFLDQHHLHGKTVVSYNWAQYFIAARCREGQSAVQFDGRFRTCYPQAIVDRHFDFILGDAKGKRYRQLASPVDPTVALTERDPKLVLLDRGQPHSEAVMKQMKDWTLLYQDSLAQVWGRSDLFNDPQSPEYLAPKQRSISDAKPQAGYVAWPAIPTPQAEATPSSHLARTSSLNTTREQP
ncbi:hypothetical protein [Blastopirellula marina]|uniref:Glycosyltransferase RgtA/B/C/D-like domain-containing protein n=1 Tax=Blastopirellula marina TaxID=124 RepID=A0A2S8GC73_9BACT|nr:hypothetical protein [Blastopirellula marina]PQO41684.1 hypothetical protein C5Y98_02875 [Blastopirellula marina]PTL46127.1 hypothetical protein C5Y97_02875 [Blastopirellula marina]